MIPALLIILLTALDVACTGVGVASGYVVEANPVMAWAFEWSLTGTMFAVLMLTPVAAAFLVWAEKRVPWVRWAMWGLVAVKVAVALNHVRWMVLVLGRAH